MIEMKDIKGKIDKLVDRLKNDDALKAQFKKDPIKAVESVLGVDLPDEAVKKIIAEAKTKLECRGEGRRGHRRGRREGHRRRGRRRRRPEEEVVRNHGINPRNHLAGGFPA